MLTALLFFAMALPDAEVARFAERVARAVEARIAAPRGAAAKPPAARPAAPGARVLLRVEDAGGLGASEQVARALREALRKRALETLVEGEARFRVSAYVSLRKGRPLLSALISEGEGEGAVEVLFAELGAAPAPGAPAAGVAPALLVRTRPLLFLGGRVLDVAVDPAGEVFVVQPEKIQVFDLASSARALKAEVAVDSGAAKLRDPLVRLQFREQPPRVELYSSASRIPSVPGFTVQGYQLRVAGAPAKIRVDHPAGFSTDFEAAEGRNFFTSGGSPGFYAWAPVFGEGRAPWVILDLAGRLMLTDASLRPLGVPAPGQFGGDVATVALPCAPTMVLAAGAEADPVRDRVSLLAVQGNGFAPLATVELDGAVRRLNALGNRSLAPAAPSVEGGPGDPAVARVLAVVEGGGATRLEEIEVRCAP